MDPKMIEMNNLRVLNDYLNQTIDALSRQPRLGQPSHLGLGFSPFAASIAPITTGIGTDTVYNPWFGSSMYGQTPFAATPFAATPFAAQQIAGFPVYGATGYGTTGYGQVDPFYAQRSLAASTFGSWQQPWSAVAEVSRTAQLCQAVCARQSVLEAACRACGIPV